MAPDPGKDIASLHDAGNGHVRGMWSDGTTMWVVDTGDEKLYAYDLATGARQSDRDIDTLDNAGNNDPRGMWSDGATVWVADDTDDKLYAYELATGARRSDRDIETPGQDAGQPGSQGLVV